MEYIAATNTVHPKSNKQPLFGLKTCSRYRGNVVSCPALLFLHVNELVFQIFTALAVSLCRSGKSDIDKIVNDLCTLYTVQ